MNLRLVTLALCSAAALLCAGCPSTGVVCTPGLIACGGTACVDVASDSRNCGGCGAACQLSQACVASRCECKEGSSLCNGVCVVLASDSRNCGTCGNACPGSQVCEAGACKTTCSLSASSICGGACVDLAADPMNCGACGNACPDTQSCHAGKCQYDLVAACFSVGTVVGIQASTGNPGPAKPVGAGPQALGLYRDVVVALDGIDQKLRQLFAPSLSEVGTPVATAASPNFVLSDPPYAYVVTSFGNTLLVVQEGGADGGVSADAGQGSADSGYPLKGIKEIDLGANTSPQAIAKLGTKLYIPLLGGFGGGASAGQKVAVVDVSNPASPTVEAPIDLSGVDLKSFDGGAAVARPYAIALRNGKLYVPLSNLEANAPFRPAGPGLVARIDPANGNAVSTLELPADKCLNPGFVASSADGRTLYVSCQGAVNYDATFHAESNEKAGVVALGADDSVRSTWNVSCPPGQGADAGCFAPMPGRFAVRGNRLFVSDQSLGRVFVLEDTGAALVERRGYADGGTPVAACATNATSGFGNVSDLVSLP